MESESRTNVIPWPAKLIIGIVALLLGMFNDALGGWGLPVAIAGAVIVIPTLKYQKYWHQRWFWQAMIFLCLLQVPLVILARPFVNQYGIAFNLVLATIDVFVIAVVVNWARPTER